MQEWAFRHCAYFSNVHTKIDQPIGLGHQDHGAALFSVELFNFMSRIALRSSLNSIFMFMKSVGTIVYHHTWRSLIVVFCEVKVIGQRWKHVLSNDWMRSIWLLLKGNLKKGHWGDGAFGLDSSAKIHNMLHSKHHCEYPDMRWLSCAKCAAMRL